MSTTKMFVVVMMIAIAIYDAIAVQAWGIDGTISRFMQDTGFRSPTFVFAFGFLAGHFWGYMPPKPISILNQDGTWVNPDLVKTLQAAGFGIYKEVTNENQKQIFYPGTK